MTESNPWSTSASTILFILDVSNTVEEKLLLDWLSARRGDCAYDGQHTTITIDVARSTERIDVGHLINVLQADDDTLLLPLRVVWQTSRDFKNSQPRLRDLLFGDPRRPGVWRAKRRLRLDPSRVHCITGVPAKLSDMRSQFREGDYSPVVSDMEFAEFVAAQAALALDIAERQLRGRRYKVPRRVAATIQNDPAYQRSLATIADVEKRSLEDVQSESRSILKELVATPRPFWQDALSAFNRKVVALGYEEIVVDQQAITRIQKVTRDHPTVFLFTHKTHMDTFALYATLFDNDLPAPHTIGGINMALPGFGLFARRAASIFIRRSFRDNAVYKTSLRSYIGFLLSKRFPLSWAFEGARSRTGKLMPPRYGILKYVLESAHATGARDLHLIPVAINFDLISDIGDYVSEQAGVMKKPENLGWFVKYINRLRKPMGRIYIEFGNPVVLGDAMSRNDQLALPKIAFQIGVEANRITPITPAALASLVLMGAGCRSLTERDMQRQFMSLLQWAKRRDIPTTANFKTVREFQLNHLLHSMINDGVVSYYDQGIEPVYGIARQQQHTAAYYRNTIVHHFISKAIAEMSLLHASFAKDNRVFEFWTHAEWLRDLFKFEFFYLPAESFRNAMREELNQSAVGWEATLESDSDGTNTRRVLELQQPLIAHACLRTFVESYRVVFEIVAQLPEDAVIDEKECVSQALRYGRQAFLQGQLTSEASIVKTDFSNACSWLKNQGLMEATTNDITSQRHQLVYAMRTLEQRLGSISVIAADLSIVSESLSLPVKGLPQ